jgi:maltooligosyltrehalose trehalohydrolase
LNWAELDDPLHAAFLDWYRRLIALRREHADLRDGGLGRTRVRFDESAQWIAIERGPLHIFGNFSRHVNQIALPGCVTPLLASSQGVQFDSGLVTLPAESIAVVKVQPTSTAHKT